MFDRLRRCRTRLFWSLPVIALVSGLILVSVLRSRAANPGNGTISPASPPLIWNGTAVGGTSNGEATCVEGVNCDTFTLTVGGTPADWVGKSIQVSVSWVVLANDYDVYIHKTNNLGPIIDSSTGGAPSTMEVADINPSIDGTGVFTVRVVYFTGNPADQYHAVATVISSDPPPPLPPLSPNWNIRYHGECCEGNLGASGANTFLLLPVLVTGNKILKSSDNGNTWVRKYPPVDASVPFGIEGDMHAWGNDVVFFGTELAQGVSAHSDDAGETWVTTQIPVAFPANDQSWGYLGPLANMRPGAALPTDEPYVMAGWYRIGSVVLFSFDGGLTWPIQTPLAGYADPQHVVCQQNAQDPTAPGDTRIANSNFAKMKSGRHGGWGTDRKFYWSETASGNLYICKTDNFGATWTGVKHPLVGGPASDYIVTHTAFDNKGTLYVLHGNKLYVSFNQGESILYVHTLPRWGNAGRADSGADQFFVVDCGTLHIGLLEDAGEGRGNVVYLRGTGVDSASPVWEEELVDVVGNVRLDFMQIVLNGNGIPTISYTTPGEEVTTASRNAPMVSLPPVNVALASNGASAIASTIHSSGLYPAAAVVNGDRTGNSWGTATGGWNDGTRSAYPDTLEISFAGIETISQINVYTLQNNWQFAGEPTEATPATAEGILDFNVQYWNGQQWVTVPNGSVTGNDKAKRVFTFAAIATSKIRVVVNASRNNWSRIVEVEAFRGCP